MWRTIWEAKEHVVSRVYHQERLVSFQDRQGQWQEGHLGQERGQMRPLARVQTTLVAKRGRASACKEATSRSGSGGVSSASDLRDQCPASGFGRIGEPAGVVGARAPGGGRAGSLAPLDGLASARCGECDPHLHDVSTTLECRRQFHVFKTCLGWEDVQVLDWQALRTLAWVAAGFLYALGVSWDWAEVQLLAKLGGWEPHKDRKPGKITLQRGLSRLLDRLVTQSVLSQYETTHQALPPQIAAFLSNWGPPHEL